MAYYDPIEESFRFDGYVRHGASTKAKFIRRDPKDRERYGKYIFLSKYACLRRFKELTAMNFPVAEVKSALDNWPKKRSKKK